MSPDSIPQISLGTAALVIFAVCAAFVIVRGMTRALVGSLLLAVSVWIGFRTWQAAPGLSHEWFGRSLGIVTTGLPLLAALVSWLLIRKLAAALARPFGKTEYSAPSRISPVARGALGLLLALIPAALVCLVAAILIHHTGAVAEIRAFSGKSPGTREPAPAGFSQRLKSSIEHAIPASWLGTLDPMSSPARLTLAKLVAAGAEDPLEPVIDPKTGRPIPRAIIVRDPELQQLAREGKFSTLLRHPLLTKSLQDPRLRALLRDLSL